MVNTIQRLASGNFGEMRDRIYVCEYVMDMFSYSSFNNEGEYHLTGDKYKLKDFSKGEYPGGGEWYSDKTATKIYENQSLTNNPMDSDHNHIHLAEAEYVLYASKNADDNLKKAYGSIFKVRLAMNMASGFVNFYNGRGATANTITGIANAIATNMLPCCRNTM
jgi:hypothetical protein